MRIDATVAIDVGAATDVDADSRTASQTPKPSARHREPGTRAQGNPLRLPESIDRPYFATKWKTNVFQQVPRTETTRQEPCESSDSDAESE